jgi:tetratricopeptide (TPR) repeat protein
MQPGDTLAERFVLENLAGRGGMGAVYRAHDRLTGETVAVKVLLTEALVHSDRFTREARILAELRHPGITRHIAHGITPDGAPWMAMEWLDGEDLADRLRRQGLTIAETVALVARVAAALAEVHVRGVIHRDLKPRNLFLPGEDLRRVKVLDFGIARWDEATVALTRTGAALGTPGYMAPEQVRGERELTPAVDIFALGCVWFECLVGRTPFHGENMMARLARVLLDDAPRVSESRTDVPDDIDELVDWMLVKDPARRVANGAALVDAIASLSIVEEGRASRVSLPPRALTSAEQRLFSVVLVGAPSVTAETVVTETGSHSTADLAAVAGTYGARVDRLPGGSLIVSFAARGTATDQAARAARCALRMRSLAPELPIALATGWARDARRAMTGEVIDRAAELLKKGADAVRTDDVTAGLLGEDFDLTLDPETGARSIRGAKGHPAGAPRTLLGKPSPFVGRERDLRVLDAYWDECEGDSVARVVLVTAAAGAGKSRLRQEFIEGLRRRGEAPVVLLGRGDLMAPGAPYGLVVSALRGACGVRDGEDASVARQKVTARLTRHLGQEDGGRVADFLGELMGVSMPENVELKAARRDARLMGDQVRRAWVTWFAAECSAAPVLVVLEDLHWGDVPSVQLFDAALAALGNQPWVLLALARPEVHDVLAPLWRERDVQELRLGELTPRASERLVRTVLGDVAPAIVSEFVARAGGNPLYLEELIRAVAEGRGEALPDTVLAMVQSRLAAMEPEARHVLRAASVFGRVFSQGGVQALVGAGGDAPDLALWFPELARREVFVRRAEGRYHGEEEYAFRHALVREAAYGMLLDDDRALGHRLAGEWLENVGEREALVLAEHYERGRAPDRAVGWYRRAAEQALGGNDLEAALARAERGADLGATGEALGALRAIEAEAYKWRGDHARSEACAREAMRYIPQGDPRWYAAAGELLFALTMRRDVEGLEAMVEDVCVPPPDEHTSCPQVVTVARLARSLLLAGRGEQLGTIGAWLARVSACPVGGDPSAAAVIHELRSFQKGFEGDPDTSDDIEAAAAGFERAGNLRAACVQRVNLGCVYSELGCYDDAERALRDALATADRMGLHNVSAGARNNLGMVLARTGRRDEALALEHEAVARYTLLGDARMAGGSRLYVAQILAWGGRFTEAEAAAREALGSLDEVPSLRAHALAVLSGALLGQGRHRHVEALAAGREAVELMDSIGGIDEGEAAVRLAYVEALDACGERERAHEALAVARTRLMARAERVRDVTRRERFLTQVKENAQTLARG